MSRITSATLLLIILIDSFYASTASQNGSHPSKGHIRLCRCRVFANGRIKCSISTNDTEKKDLRKCLCSKTNQHKFPEIKAACSKQLFSFPISLI
ncbi:uncharacterized protein ACO6RY_03504 [Pungitius sinensis]